MESFWLSIISFILQDHWLIYLWHFYAFKILIFWPSAILVDFSSASIYFEIIKNILKSIYFEKDCQGISQELHAVGWKVYFILFKTWITNNISYKMLHFLPVLHFLVFGLRLLDSLMITNRQIVLNDHIHWYKE
jgi:hypothetical protein